MQQITQETMIALTAGQTITFIVVLVSAFGGMIPMVRTLERNRLQIIQNKADIAELLKVTRIQGEQIASQSHSIDMLTQQMQTLVKMRMQTSRAATTRKKDA